MSHHCCTTFDSAYEHGVVALCLDLCGAKLSEADVPKLDEHPTSFSTHYMGQPDMCGHWFCVLGGLQPTIILRMFTTVSLLLNAETSKVVLLPGSARY